MKSIRSFAALASFIIICCLVRLTLLNTEEFQQPAAQISNSRILREEGSPPPTQERQRRVQLHPSQYPSSVDSKYCNVDIDWSKKVKPKYELDRTKFLVPTLINGPNNQMMGLQQSVLMSLVLNRTLVLPLFYHHQIDKFFRTIVPPEYRLNMKRLREYVTVIPLQEALKLCNYKLDAIFTGRPFNMLRKGTATMVRVAMETGFHEVDFADGVGKKEIAELKKYLYSDGDIHIKESLRKKEWWPANRSDENWAWKIVKSDRHQKIPMFPKVSGSSDLTEMRSLYSTDAKCALHWYPFREFPFKKSNDMLLEEIGKFDIHHFTREDGWKIHSDIIFNTPAPDAVVEWSKRFRNAYLYHSHKNYISVHWRFDDDDFYDYICKKESRQVFCDEVKRATNITAIAKAILTQIADLDRTYRIGIGAVYIAAPPTLNDLVQGVASKLKNVEFVRKILSSSVPGPKILTYKQLEEYILRNFKDCAMAKPRQLSDTISQIEMDICTESYAFMWSRQSTWSVNVKRRRFLEGKASNVDHSILEFVLARMKDDDEP